VRITSRQAKGTGWVTFEFIDANGRVIYELATYKTGHNGELPDIIDVQELARADHD